jgi:hypothetical protein
MVLDPLVVAETDDQGQRLWTDGVAFDASGAGALPAARGA